MKKKLFFLCTMLAFSASLGSTTKECITKTDDTVNEVNVGGKQGRLDAKVIPDRYIDCPWCGRATIINKTDSVHLCAFCRRDIYASTYDKRCPWCNTNNTIPRGSQEQNWTCRNCYNFVNDSMEISVKANYCYKGTPSPLIGCKAELCSYVSGNYSVVATTHSDDQGICKFKLQPNNVSNPRNNSYKIRIYPGDDNLVVTTNVHFETSSNSTQSNTYWAKEYTTLFPCVDTPCYNIKLGRTYKCSDIEVNINSSDPYSDGLGMCFYIAQAGLRAKEFATKMMGYTPKIAVLTYDSYADGSYYDSDVLHIACTAWDSMFDTVMHEYGHHLQYQLKNRQFNVPGNHNPEKPVNKAYAWKEAWPTVFAKVAQNYTPASKIPAFTLKYGFGGRKFGNATVYDIGSNDHNSVYLSNNGFAGKGEEIEEVIGEILWDIFDYNEDGIESFDKVDFGYEYWFFITTRENTFTIKNLYDNLTNYYPQFESQVKDLFAYHGITY